MNQLPKLLFFLALPCFAQTLSLTCPASVKTGATLICGMSISNAQSTSGLQYTVTSTPSLGNVTVTSTGSAATAFKGIYANGAAILLGGFGPPPPGTMNAGLIPDGTIATLSFLVPTSIVNTNVTISIAGGILPALATSSAGSVITVTPGPSQSVSVLPNTSLCDINGDGLTNQADVDAQLSMVLAFPQVTKCARNGSGCNVAAVQIVVNAALGGACTATQ